MADDPIKSRLAMSVGLHIAVLVGSTVVFVTKPYNTPPAEALPIDIISSTEFSQYMAGSKNAKPAPTPKPLAEKTGDPKPVDDPTPKVSEKQEIKMASADPQQPVPPVKPEQKAEKKPDPKPEKKPDAKPDAQKQPDSKPDPIAEALKKDDKPEKKVEEKKAEVKPPPQPPKKPAKEYKFDPMQTAALLDKRDAQRHAATGAELNPTPSLGLSNANAMALSQSELDALRAQIQSCFDVPAGGADVRNMAVEVHMEFNKDGSLKSDPVLLNRGTGVFQIMAESALRAIRRCAPYRLPIAKYEVWKEVEVTFDLRDLFRG